MRVVVVTPPAPIVTWEEADAHLGLGGDVSHQIHVESLIAAATAQIDGPGGWLGRAIGVQTLEARLDAFPWNIRLPFDPAISVESVKWVSGGAGVENTYHPEAYYLAGQRVVLNANYIWPNGPFAFEGVRIRYSAGYEVVPAPIKTAILMMVAHMYENREASEAPGCTMAEMLLAPYRVYR